LKYLIVIFLTLSIQSTTYAHKYYFGFAEVEYNSFTQRFEATLTVTAHDLELALKENETSAGDLVKLDSTQSKIVETYINEGFQIKSLGQKCRFKLVGHESKLDGTVNFYLESTEIQINESIIIEFDVLMQNYDAQQNKVTLYYADAMYTRAFTQGTKQQTIEINRE
jgi:hypothetical protein